MTREVCMVEKSGRPNKERINEMNLMHGHFPSCKIMHCITFAYCIEHVFFSSGAGMRSLAPDKSFKKTFGEKEDNSNRLELLKDLSQLSQNSTNWQPSVSLDENE